MAKLNNNSRPVVTAQACMMAAPPLFMPMAPPSTCRQSAKPSDPARTFPSRPMGRATASGRGRLVGAAYGGGGGAASDEDEVLTPPDMGEARIIVVTSGKVGWLAPAGCFFLEGTWCERECGIAGWQRRRRRR